jgi:TetR/AcrR family transcriptional regulator, transcriptional repressor for nem operon
MAKATRARPAPSPALEGDAVDPARFLRYADYLEHQIAHAPKRTKGARTKDALKLGAIRVLDEVGYHAMRVSDICEAAGVALATFYLYFTNKSDITLTVLSEYLDQGMGHMALRDGARTPFEAIRAANLRWLQGIRANAGLSRCITQLGDEEPGFRELAHRINRQWYERIAQSFVRRFSGAVPEDVALLAAYSLGAMMDEVARKLVVYPDPALLTLVGKIAPTDEDISDFLTVLWHRALYGGVPEGAKLGEAARIISALKVV